jgi:hypothetical protein
MEIAWNQTNPFFYRYDIQYAIQPCWKCNNYHQMHNLGIVTKLFIPSNIKTQLNLVPFCFWADWAVLALLKTKVFFHYFMTFCTFNVSTEKLIYKKVRKKVNIGVFIVHGMYHLGDSYLFREKFRTACLEFALAVWNAGSVEFIRLFHSEMHALEYSSTVVIR